MNYDKAAELMDSVPAGLLVVDKDMKVCMFNHAWSELCERCLGKKPENGMSLTALIPDETPARMLADALHGKTVRHNGFRFETAAYCDSYFDLTAAPAAGGAMLMAVDSTERCNALQSAEAARSEAEFYVDLMSHDIRNFNQVSMGYLEMLELSENLSEDERAYLTKALSGVHGSNRLIENVRTVRTVIESGDQNIAPTDLGKVLQENIEQTRKAHSGQPIQINAHIPEGGKIMANQYVHEIFRHILENSIKYDQHPEKVIDIDVVEPGLEGKAYWTVRITDRGRGIPEERRRAIFERIGQTTKGSGIGMSMVNMIVTKLGGRVWVEDRVPGDYTQGSVFVVQLRRA